MAIHFTVVMAGGEVSFPSSEGQSSYKSVDAGYAVRLMREIGKVLSEKQVEILHGRFGDDVKAGKRRCFYMKTV